MLFRTILALAGLILINQGAVLAQDTGNSTDRLSAIKNNYSINLSDDLKQKIVINCAEATTNIAKIQQNNLSVSKKRLFLYKDVTKELKAIEFRTLKQGVDTSELDLLLGKNQQQIQKISDLNSSQEIVVNDLKSIDCKASPDLYLAGLYKFRSNQKEIINNSKDIQLHLRNSYEDSFKPLSERLSL